MKTFISKILIASSIAFTAAIFFFAIPQKSFAASCTWKAAATGVWSNAANWSCGAVPGVADDVIFSASSTQNSTWDSAGAPAQVKSVTVNASYTGILSLARNASVAGSWIMNGTGFLPGTFTLQFGGANVAATFTPGNVGYGPLDDAQTGISTLTLTGNATTTGSLTFSGGSQSMINGGSITVTGNVSSSATFATAMPSAGTTLVSFVFTLGGNHTIASLGGWLPGISIDIGTGITATLIGTVPVSGNWTVSASTPVASIVAGSTSTLKFVGTNAGTVTFTPGKGNYSNIEDALTSAALSLGGATATTTTSLVLSGGPLASLTNGTFVVQGSLNVSSTNFASSNNNAGNATLLFSSSSVQTISSLGGWLPNISITKSTGSIKVTSTSTLAISGNFLNTGGAPINFGTSTTRFVGVNNTSLISAGVGIINGFYNLEDAQTGTSVLAFSAQGSGFGIGSGSEANNNFLITGTGAASSSIADKSITPGAGELVVVGNVIISSPDFGTGASSASSSEIIDLEGSISQTLTSSGGILPNLHIGDFGGIPAVRVLSSLRIKNNFSTGFAETRLASSTSPTTFEVDGVLDVEGELSDFAGVSSTIILGGSVTDNGAILFDQPTGCSAGTPLIVIKSLTGSQISWTGSGAANMQGVSVSNQGGTLPVTVSNGASGGGNGANWKFLTGPAVFLVQSAINDSILFSQNTNIATFGEFTPVAGDTIIAVAVSQAPITSIADTSGDTFTLFSSSTVNGITMNAYYAKNIIAGTLGTSLSVTALTTNLNNFYLSAFEFSGISTSTPLDVSTKNSDPVGSLNPTAGNMTGSGAGELYFGAYASASSTTTAVLTAGSPWAAGQSGEGDISSSSVYMSAFYTYAEMLSESSPTTLAPNWVTTSTVPYMAVGAVFKVSSTGSSGGSTLYPASGTLDSYTYDTGSTSGATLNSVTWTGVQPAGTSVGLQLAVSNSANGPWSYIGPDGTSATYFTNLSGKATALISSTGGYSLFAGYRYFRYRVTLFSDVTRTLTPTVNRVTVSWSP